MEQLVELARRLGRQMAGHERTTKMKEAQKAVNEDEEAKKLIEEYQKQALKIEELEEANKPIEVEDKHKLRDIEQKLSLHPKLRELTRRQVDFIEMTRKVKQAIDEQLEV
jgi:cell fate (sporulation/competence/biofilm development) regulator YlbF (YheA/YmcA/DUF963 family)